MLKNCANELNGKIQILVEELAANGPAEMANKFEDVKKVVSVLVENILKPLLNVIDKQMQKEYGKIDKKHLKVEYGKTVDKYFREKTLALPMEMVEKLAIPEKMIVAEIAMIEFASALKIKNSTAIRQLRVE